MTGLFFVSYVLGDPAANGTMLQLNLAIDTVSHSLRGHYQATRQGSRAGASVSGTYETLSLPTAKGMFIVAKLESELPDPVTLQRDLNLHMMLSMDWKNGNASFRFRKELTQDVPVALEPTRQFRQAAQNQLEEYLRCTYGRAFGAYLPAAFELSFVD